MKRCLCDNPPSDPSFYSSEWGTVYVVLDYYKTGNLTVQLFTEEEGYREPLGTLSVNIPDKLNLLEHDEFFVKTCNENTGLARDAAKSGLFLRTDKSAQTGYVVAPVWKISGLLTRMITLPPKTRKH